MSEDAPLDHEPIQQGVEHGPYDESDELWQVTQHGYAAGEAYRDGRITEDAHTKLASGAEAARIAIYDKQGVQHGPYKPLESEALDKAAQSVEKDYGYKPEGDEVQLLQESHQLRQHSKAVEDAYDDYPGITHANREERHASIDNARENIHYEHEDNARASYDSEQDARKRSDEERESGAYPDDDESDPEREAGGGTTNQERIAASYYSRDELDKHADMEALYDTDDDDFSGAARIAKDRLGVEDDEADDDTDDDDERWVPDDDDDDEYDATPEDAAEDFQIHRGVPEDSRSDAEIERDEDIANRLHMSGSDDPEAYWAEYDELHGTVNGGQEPSPTKAK